MGVQLSPSAPTKLRAEKRARDYLHDSPHGDHEKEADEPRDDPFPCFADLFLFSGGEDVLNHSPQKDHGRYDKHQSDKLLEDPLCFAEKSGNGKRKIIQRNFL